MLGSILSRYAPYSTPEMLYFRADPGEGGSQVSAYSLMTMRSPQSPDVANGDPHGPNGLLPSESRPSTGSTEHGGKKSGSDLSTPCRRLPGTTSHSTRWCAALPLGHAEATLVSPNPAAGPESEAPGIPKPKAPTHSRLVLNIAWFPVLRCL